MLRFGTLLEPWRLDSAPVRGITSMTNMATRHVAPPGFPAPQRRSRQAKSSPGQPSLSRKERQQAYLVRDLVAELEHKHGTNTVHAINFSFGKRSTSVSIVLNRERGIQDTHGQHEVADGPPAAWITIQSGQTTSFACSNAMAFGWTGRHTAQTASQFSS